MSMDGCISFSKFLFKTSEAGKTKSILAQLVQQPKPEIVIVSMSVSIKEM
jgi:hypothetical protein